MVKVTKKAVQIEAYQYIGPDEFIQAYHEGTLPDWLSNAVADKVVGAGAGASGDKLLIQSNTHGQIVANPTDWIMYGVEGELYPCKDSVFLATYDIDEVIDPRDPNPELS